MPVSSGPEHGGCMAVPELGFGWDYDVAMVYAAEVAVVGIAVDIDWDMVAHTAGDRKEAPIAGKAAGSVEGIVGHMVADIAVPAEDADLDIHAVDSLDDIVRTLTSSWYSNTLVELEVEAVVMVSNLVRRIMKSSGF